MRIGVTGGRGFIGSYACEALAAAGHKVFAIDDQRDAVLEESPEGITDLWGDAGDAVLYTSFEPRLEAIVHAASPVGPVALLGTPGIVEEIVRTTATVARAAVRDGSRLLNISTSEVYGRPGRYHETDTLEIPARYSARDEYAVGKLAGERIVATAAQAGADTMTIRPFNVAGPRQSRRKGFVLPTFAEQALEGDPVTIFGDGHQERAFTAAEDVALYIVRAFELEPETWDGRPINVGNPRNQITIGDLARRVLTVTDKRLGREPDPATWRIRHTTGKEVHGPLYEEAIGTQKLPLIGEAEALGWRPRVDLETLIERTVAAKLRQPA